MTDYQPVQDALSNGADPAMLCATCPWDRYCISPPSMTKADIDKRMAEAKTMDDKAATEARLTGQRSGGLPVATLMSALTFGGKDTMGQLCPVFSLRLRSSQGRKVADSIKASMQAWDDQA